MVHDQGAGFHCRSATDVARIGIVDLDGLDDGPPGSANRRVMERGAMPGRPSKLAKVAAYVDGALHRQDLTVRTIAFAVGISRSVLYRHFTPFGGIARYVRDRRLVALHRAVACAGERRPFAEIAKGCGYASPSHASRRFKDRYGVAPGLYRRLARAGGA